MKRSDFCAQLDRMVAAMRDDADFLERTADRMEALDEARIPAYKCSGPITDRVHCAWCDGEGRCGGIAGADADVSVWDAALSRITGVGQKLCEDCPPVDYPTDETRCVPCPRRVADETIDKALRDLRDFVEHGKHPGEVITVTLADATSLVEYIGDGNDALAACQAQAAGRIRELTEALQGFVRWANAKCPCENEQPNPCPLCGASIFEGCKAADQTLPRELLEAARAALSKARGLQP